MTKVVALTPRAYSEVMRRSVMALVLAVTGTVLCPLLTSCSHSCTVIGASSGVSVLVDDSLLKAIGSGPAQVRVWLNGTCRADAVRAPSAATPSDPTQGASLRESAQFIQLDLPAERTTIQVSVVRGEQNLSGPHAVQITPRTVRPNWPDCPGEAHNAAVLLSQETATQTQDL